MRETSHFTALYTSVAALLVLESSRVHRPGLASKVSYDESLSLYMKRRAISCTLSSLAVFILPHMCHTAGA